VRALRGQSHHEAVGLDARVQARLDHGRAHGDGAVLTTIAWDGRTLAADTRGINGGIARSVSKLFECGDYVFAGCGILSEVLETAKWLRTVNMPGTLERPTYEECDILGIAVERETGKAYFVAGKRPILEIIAEPFSAAGSGRDFALAAMALGQSAEEAVRLAMRFDLATGGEVESIEVVATSVATP
jgi:20S proteasome alpha/beta subunit